MRAHGLAEPEVDRVASWWHNDGDLGLTDSTRSRAAGFTGYRSTLQSFTAAFDQLAEQRITPSVVTR